MNRITISGVAVAFRDSDGQVESDPEILRRFNGHVYEDERFTDYIGGPDEENELAARLNPSGFLRFEYDGESDHLIAITEYESRRTLNDKELKLLVEFTLGQWSDGVGENFACFTPFNLGISVQCQTDGLPIVSQTHIDRNRG